MRPNAALEIIDFSGNCTYSEDYRCLQRLNLQSLHNCSSLVWPFGVGHQNYACPGLLAKPSTYTPFEKKSLTEMVHSSPDICAGLSPALLCSLEWVPWIILGQVFHCQLAEVLDPSVFPVAVPFPNPCQPHWRNAATGCDCDSSNKDHWTSSSDHPARWL